MLRELLVEMFDEMVIAKNIEALDRYYDPGFTLHTNEQTQGYAEFCAGHERVYPTEIQYRIRYDETAWVESADRLAARVWITTSRPQEEPTAMEVILIAKYRDGRLIQLWELTWPDWRALGALENY